MIHTSFAVLHTSGLMQISSSASFTAAQFLTAMMWGRIADSSLFGRKTVLMIGLGGTSESLILGNTCLRVGL